MLEPQKRHTESPVGRPARRCAPLQHADLYQRHRRPLASSWQARGEHSGLRFEPAGCWTGRCVTIVGGGGAAAPDIQPLVLAACAGGEAPAAHYAFLDDPSVRTGYRKQKVRQSMLRILGVGV